MRDLKTTKKTDSLENDGTEYGGLSFGLMSQNSSQSFGVIHILTQPQNVTVDVHDVFLGYRGRRGLHLSSQCDVMMSDLRRVRHGQT